MLSKIKLAIIGSRGIPAKYGGFEIFTELLAMGLDKDKYDITVSCEVSGFKKIDIYLGATLKYFPLPPPKSYLLRKLYEALNDIYFLLKLSHDNDVLYFLGVGTSGFFSFMPKLINRDIKLVINIDGLEWRRDKFSFVEKFLLRLNNQMAEHFCDVIVVDSRSLIKYIGKFGDKAMYIPYGVCDPELSPWDSNLLNCLPPTSNELSSIQKRKYYLVVARLEPENNIHVIIKGFLASSSIHPLCIVGNPSDFNYMKELQKMSHNNFNKKIIFFGGIYESRLLNMLRQNAFAYIHGHSVGGTNPSLLDAMIMKNLILAHNNEFNREVGGESMVYFDNEVRLSELINEIENNYTDYIYLQAKTYDRVKKYYSWDVILTLYDRLFSQVYSQVPKD